MGMGIVGLRQWGRYGALVAGPSQAHSLLGRGVDPKRPGGKTKCLWYCGGYL